MNIKQDLQAKVKALLKGGLSGDRLRFINEEHESIKIELTEKEGLVNDIYRIQSVDGKNSVIMKYGTETPQSEDLAVISIPMARQEIEYECLKMLHHILPGCVPEPYHLDTNLHYILMEDLGPMEQLSARLRKGDVDIDLAARVGGMFSFIQRKTHKNLVSPEMWKQLQTKLRHEGLRDIVFWYRSDCFMEHGKLLDIQEDWASDHIEWCKEIRENRTFEKMKELFSREDCFVHIDVHHHAVFANEDRIAMIDFEFGNLANQAYALGCLMPFYVLNMVEYESKQIHNCNENRDKIKQALYAMYSAFITGFGDKVYALGPLSAFVSELTAFMGHTLYVIALFKGHASLFTLNNSMRHKLAKLGIELMHKSTKVNTFDLLMDTIFLDV